VNDYARLLSDEARQQLESRLAAREQATGAQMVIAIFPSLEGESLEDVGIRVAERWRVGDRRLDNGVILLVFLQERRVRMEVGYGLEPALPDAEAARIIRDAIGPRFREQRYAAGLEAAVAAVYARVEGRDSPAARGTRDRASPWALGMLVVLAVVVLLLARAALSAQGRARRHGYTAGGRRGWHAPSIGVPPRWGGWGGGRSGGGGFTPGGGSFGGGGASGRW
jgi:uncharacterized protein